MRRWACNASNLYQKWEGKTCRNERDRDKEDNEVDRTLAIASRLPEEESTNCAPEHWTENPEYRAIYSHQCIHKALRSKNCSPTKDGGNRAIKGEQEVGECEEC